MDVKKLEKQEAKLKVFMSYFCFALHWNISQAKIEKRSRRDLYEGSKLLDQHRKQVLHYWYSENNNVESEFVLGDLANIRRDVYESKYILP